MKFKIKGLLTLALALIAGNIMAAEGMYPSAAEDTLAEAKLLRAAQEKAAAGVEALGNMGESLTSVVPLAEKQAYDASYLGRAVNTAKGLGTGISNAVAYPINRFKDWRYGTPQEQQLRAMQMGFVDTPDIEQKLSEVMGNVGEYIAERQPDAGLAAEGLSGLARTQSGYAGLGGIGESAAAAQQEYLDQLAAAGALGRGFTGPTRLDRIKSGFGSMYGYGADKLAGWRDAITGSQLYGAGADRLSQLKNYVTTAGANNSAIQYFNNMIEQAVAENPGDPNANMLLRQWQMASPDTKRNMIYGALGLGAAAGAYGTYRLMSNLYNRLRGGQQPTPEEVAAAVATQQAVQQAVAAEQAAAGEVAPGYFQRFRNQLPSVGMPSMSSVSGYIPSFSRPAWLGMPSVGLPTLPAYNIALPSMPSMPFRTAEVSDNDRLEMITSANSLESLAGDIDKEINEIKDPEVKTKLGRIATEARNFTPAGRKAATKAQSTADKLKALKERVNKLKMQQ